MELITCSEMRDLEQSAIKAGRVTGLELMERAGQAIVEAIFEAAPDFSGSPSSVCILCGPGNNGGDGFVVARLLAGRGWAVTVFCFGPASRLPPDARTNHDRWLQTGSVSPLDDAGFETYPDAHPETVLYVDALFGAGLSRPFTSFGQVQDTLNYVQSLPVARGGPWVVSVDVPSGMCGDTGGYPGFEEENPLDMCIVADLTVTFHRAKVGHFLGDGPHACGELVIKDIGL